ncbi:MAG: LemA family protein [Bacteroidia bacterium]|nr:LemA family protein [Bacteroidia bacterium]
MKRSYVLLALGLGLISLFGLSGCQYNSMVEKREAVTSQWAQVENVYQRRADLIPNLVNTVKGAANFEQGTLEKVMQARASATQVKIDANNLSPESIAKFQSAQDGLSSALGKLMMVTENYPDLKSNQNFSELQSQLEGTENRIATERMKFNEKVQEYNSYIQKFPNNMISGMFGFDKKGYFTAAPGSEKAPEVKF